MSWDDIKLTHTVGGLLISFLWLYFECFVYSGNVGVGHLRRSSVTAIGVRVVCRGMAVGVIKNLESLSFSQVAIRAGDIGLHSGEDMVVYYG